MNPANTETKATRVVTVPEAAAIYRMSPRGIYVTLQRHGARAGALRAGRVVRVDLDAFDAFLRSGAEE